MRPPAPPLIQRRAFPGFRFERITLEEGDNYTSFQVLWKDDRKEEIIQATREDPIEFKLHMN
jgi:hypothetical protein